MNRNYDWISPQLLDIHQKLKYRRIVALAELIERRHTVGYKRFLAEMQFHGIRRNVAEEYLEIMRDMDLIRLHGDRIVWNNQQDAYRSRV